MRKLSRLRPRCCSAWVRDWWSGAKREEKGARPLRRRSSQCRLVEADREAEALGSGKSANKKRKLTIRGFITNHPRFRVLRCSRRNMSASDAIDELNRQLELASDSKQRAELLLQLAVQQGLAGRFDEARRSLEEANASVPDDTQVRIAKDYIDGVMCHAQSNCDAAFRKLTAVLENFAAEFRNPELRFMYEDIQQRRAAELVQLLRFAEALAVCDECLSFDLEDVEKSDILANRALSVLKLERYEEAASQFRSASNLGLSTIWDDEIHFHYAVTFARLNRYEEAKGEFLLAEQCRTQRIPRSLIYRWLAWTCTKLGDQQEAERYKSLSTIN